MVKPHHYHASILLHCLRQYLSLGNIPYGIVRVDAPQPKTSDRATLMVAGQLGLKVGKMWFHCEMRTTGSIIMI